MSPQTRAYTPEYLSPTPGDYFWVGVDLRRHRLQHRPGPGRARRRRPGRTCSTRAGATRISAKQATSGMQYMQWYMLRQAVRQRLLAGVRQAAPARLRLARAAVRPAGQGRRQGVRAGRIRRLHALQGEGRADRLRGAARRAAGDARCCGVVNKAPHPEAAKLFIDWPMSPRGQEVLPAATRICSTARVRKDAPPMPRRQAAGRLQAARARPTWTTTWPASPRSPRSGTRCWGCRPARCESRAGRRCSRAQCRWSAAAVALIAAGRSCSTRSFYLLRPRSTWATRRRGRRRRTASTTSPASPTTRRSCSTR